MLAPFKIAVSDADLEDLQRRLAATRWPDEVEGVAWEYGIPLGTVKVRGATAGGLPHQTACHAALISHALTRTHAHTRTETRAPLAA